jgi:SNF2 family DNA or RNA helicase
MIEKYEKVTGAFFIFDEQRAIGSGKWGKKFIKIAKANRWIMLSATPGDTWLDYANLFIANGFYKHKTEFISEHVVFSRFSKFPKVERYINCERLVRYRDSIVVPMPFERDTVRHELTIKPKYDASEYKRVLDIRRDPRTNLPMQNAGQLCYALRYVVNKDPSRADAIKKLTEKHDRLIVFYNFIYELDILREMCEELEINYAEWNGERHESIPSTKRWIYLVQYTAGAEGWNCISTNVVVFYSQNYSYKIMAQSAGRIDRLNTKYIDLYYYHLISDASIDKAISRTLAKKETFNEKLFAESQK